MTIFSRRLILLASLLLLDSAARAETKTMYTFGVVPQQTAVRMARSWVPLTKYLKKKTGYEFRFATAKNITSFHSALDSGRYDFAYMNPLQYIQHSGPDSYKAMAHARDKQIRGIIVVKKDSKLSSFSALQGQAVAFPSKEAFGASIIVQTDLHSHGAEIKPVYVVSHDSVYQNVAKGNFVAGGGVMRTFAALPETVKKQLKIFHITNGYTPHAIAAHSRVPDEVSASVLQALIDMENDVDGREILGQIKIKGWLEASDTDWNDVRHDFPLNGAGQPNTHGYPHLH